MWLSCASIITAHVGVSIHSNACVFCLINGGKGMEKSRHNTVLNKSCATDGVKPTDPFSSCQGNGGVFIEINDSKLSLHTLLILPPINYGKR